MLASSPSIRKITKNLAQYWNEWATKSPSTPESRSRKKGSFLCSNRLMNNEKAYRASQKYEQSSFHQNKKFDLNNVQVRLQDSVLKSNHKLQQTAVSSLSSKTRHCFPQTDFTGNAKVSALNKITKIQIKMSGFALFENECSMANSQTAQTSKIIERKIKKQINHEWNNCKNYEVIPKRNGKHFPRLGFPLHRCLHRLLPFERSLKI